MPTFHAVVKFVNKSHERALMEVESWPLVVLHAVIKKTQQTPDRELKLAHRRLKELQDG
jgi:Phage derived protein Gp49-like (DUF891)